MSFHALQSTAPRASLPAMPQPILNHLLCFDPDSVRTLQAVSRGLKHLSSAFLGLSQREMRALCCDEDSPLHALIHGQSAPSALEFHWSLPEKIRLLGFTREECPDKILSPQEVSRFNQKLLETQLQKIWDRLNKEIAEADPSAMLVQAERIAPWMQQHRAVMQSLINIDLTCLDLPWLPLQIGMCSNLQVISLSYNRLGTLSPGIFEGMGNLRKLYLQGNEISSLSSGTFQGLGQLQLLSLFGNRLKTVPHDLFSGLVQLEEIHLGRNELEALPPTLFQGLPQLQVIYLNCNQLYALPPTLFQGVPQLNRLYLHDNPLMVSWNTVWKACNYIGFLPRVTDDFFNYRCESPLAQFYQHIAADLPQEVLWDSFQKLDFSFKNPLSKRVHDGDMQALRRALQEMVRGRFEGLSGAQKTRVYGHLVDLGVRGHTQDLQWWEDHAGDHVLRLIDAMCRLRGTRRTWSQAFSTASPS